MLEILNQMSTFLPLREQSIVSYLNAHDLYMRNENYMESPAYEKFLLDSIEKSSEPFVNNRMLLSKLYHGEKSEKLFKEALSNIITVNSLKEIKKMTIEDFINPKTYINEFITGTSISEINYQSILEENEIGYK